MDLVTKLFSLNLDVEPNTDTLKGISKTLNSAVLSLAEKQKAFEQYADTAEGQRYIAQAPAPTPKQKKQVVWQITETKMRELEWQRAQLIRYQKEQMAKAKAAKGKAAIAPKTTAPKLGRKGGNTPRKAMSVSGAPPKLPQKNQLPKRASSVNGAASRAPQANGVAQKASQANGVPPKASQAKGVAKKAPQPSGVASKAQQATGKAPQAPKLNGAAK